MPKRVAEEYITKENGSTANNPTEGDKPKMSTAAQQARRKIATPRGRLGGNRSSHSSSSFGTSNPFAQSTTQQQPFPSMNGGVAFGVSQSFPQGSAGTSSSFNFQPPQASSFTFGAPSDTPNPFANLNGTVDAQDISMESPQKKPAFGSAFGTNNFTFGQPAAQQSNAPFSFGGTQTANTNGTSLFGQSSKPAEPTATTNLFGQPSQSQPLFGGFGQSSSTTQSQTPAFSFGQSKTVPQSPLPTFGTKQGPDTNPLASKFTFGQTSTPLQNQGTGFGSTPPATQSSGSSMFGSTPAPTSSTGFSSSTSNAYSFGQNSAPGPSIGNPFANLGASKVEEPKTATPLFGAVNTSQPPVEPQHQPSSSEKPTASKSDAQPANPFAGLFAGGSGSTPAIPTTKPIFNLGATSQPAAPAPEKQETTTKKSPFRFGETAQPKLAAEEAEPKSNAAFKFGPTAPTTGAITSGLFEIPANSDKPAAQSEALQAAPPTEKAQRDAEKPKETAPKSLFSLAAPSKPAPSGGLFSPLKPSEEGKGANGRLFSKLSSAVETSPQPLFNAQPRPALGSSHQQPTISSSFPSAPKAAVDESRSSVGPTVPQPSSVPTLFSGLSRPEAQQPQTAQKFSPTSTAFPATIAQAGQPTAVKQPSLSAGPAGALVQKASENAKEYATVLEPVKRPVYTKAPSHVPGHTTPQQFQEFDRDYRLHSLNYGLQKKLATLDPRSQDFDNIIRHYVAARDSIGASLGLYVRNVAGTKRKADRVDDREEETEQNKRTRETFSQKPIMFGSQPTPALSDSTNPVASNTANGRQAPSTETKMLKDGITGFGSKSMPGISPPTTGVTPKATPFAGATSTSVAGYNPFLHVNQGTEVPSSMPSTTPTKSPPKKPTFEVPKFGSGNTDFLAAFGQKAKESADKFEKDLIEKRKAEEFDSDEDDEETFRKRIEEESRAKKAKIDAVAKEGFKPTFGSSMTAEPPKVKDAIKATFTRFTPSNSANPFSALTSKDASAEGSEAAEADENENSRSSNDQAEHSDEDETDGDGDGDSEEGGESEDDLPEDEVAEENREEDDEDDNDLQAAMDRARSNPNAGKSLFERIEPNPNKEKTAPMNGDKNEFEAGSPPLMQSAKNSSFHPSTWGSHIDKSMPEQPSLSPFGSSTSASTVKPASGFHFTPTAGSATPTPAPGASIFSGGATKQGPVPGEGLFGSRPSTPSNADKNGSLAKSVLTSPAGTDNTWKEGAPISFANGEKPTTAPIFKFTAPSPGEKQRDSDTTKPLSTLFGTTAPGSRGSETPSLGFQFGAPTPSPAPGYLGAISHLGGGSVASSAVSSRATSPGLTDNESVATNETDESTEDPQTSLMDSRAGEENEICLWEGRSKALMFANKETAKGTKYTPNAWNSMGVGQIRVLKNRETSKTRAVFRVEPSANILFNSHLVGSTKYESVPSNNSGAVRGALMYKGNLTRLVFKLKTPEMANELAKILEENKSA